MLLVRSNFRKISRKMSFIHFIQNFNKFCFLQYEDFIAFYNAYFADDVNNAMKNIWLLLRIFGLMFADLLMLIVGKHWLYLFLS